MVQLSLKRVRRRSTPPLQLGVIDVGSHAVRLDIFEVGEDGRTELLEHLSHPFELGRDVFRNGSVSPEMLENLCGIIAGFRDKLAEYGVAEVRAVATSALRESYNRELVIDRLRGECGISLELLESSQEITLLYQAFREMLGAEGDISERSGLGLVIGSGSIFVFYFESGLLRFCEEIPLGTDRFSRSAAGTSEILREINGSLQSLNLPRRVSEAAEAGAGDAFDFFVIGGTPRRLAEMAGVDPGGSSGCAEISAGAISATVRRVISMEAGEVAEELHQSHEAALRIMTGAALLDYFTGNFNCRRIFVPGLTTRSAVVRDILRARNTPDHWGFKEDLISLCDAVGRKFGYDAGHAAETARISMLLLEKLKRDFDFPPRAGILLEVAARLHDIGRFVDVRQHHKHSAYLIGNLQLPGLTIEEKQVVAAVARYHRRAVPADGHGEYTLLPPASRVLILKLAAILRVADALDVLRYNRFQSLSLRRHGRVLFIGIRGGGDFSVERRGLRRKGGLFNDVFGLEVRIDEGIS